MIQAGRKVNNTGEDLVIKKIRGFFDRAYSHQIKAVIYKDLGATDSQHNFEKVWVSDPTEVPQDGWFEVAVPDVFWAAGDILLWFHSKQLWCAYRLCAGWP